MYIIDRFEGDIAVIETDSAMIELPRRLLPPEAAEGDVLCKDGDAYQIDTVATQQRREEIARMMKGLWG